MRRDEAFTQMYTFNIVHKWGLPGVKCETCGSTGAIWRSDYPQVLLPKEINPEPYESPWPVSPDRIAELAVPILSLIPQGLPFGPGSEFGPLAGGCSPRRGDIIFTNYNVPLVILG